MSQIIKVYLNDDIRRVRAGDLPSYDSLLAYVSSAYTNALPARWVLKWRDEDDEWVTIQTQLDYEEAMRAAQARPLRINVLPLVEAESTSNQSNQDVKRSVEDVLSQTLPELTFNPPRRSSLSSTVPQSRHSPLLLEPWTDFAASASGFHPQSVVMSNVERTKPLVDIPMNIENEAGIMFYLKGNVAIPLQACGVFGSFKSRDDDREEQDYEDIKEPAIKKRKVVLGRPDFFHKQDNQIHVTMEVKPPWIVHSIPDSAQDICQWFHEHATNDKLRPPRRSIAQVAGYMLDNKVQFGALSSYNRTWFLRTSDGMRFEISDAIYCSQTEPTALRAFAYLSSVAAASPALEISAKFERRITKHELGENYHDQDSGEDSGDGDSGDGDSGDGDSGDGDSGDRVQEIPFSQVLVRRCLGRGRCADVFDCDSPHGHLAIKFYDMNDSESAEAAERELSLFHTLEAQQGIIVPKLHSISFSPSGHRLGLLVTLGKSLPPSFSQWSPMLVQSAFRSLRVLAECGYAQADIHPGNFVLLQDRVVCCDLETIQKLPANEVPKYLKNLKRTWKMKCKC